MDGILLIDKPKNWTSFDVVAKVRGLIRKETLKKPKVGHSGTLDPLATGLVVILCGSYCKRASEFSKMDKIYKVTMKLGQTSTTGDEEGEKTEISAKKPLQSEIDQVLKKFTGEIMQTPPAYSAIKINGQRAYRLARAGKEVKLEPRPAIIYEITDVVYDFPHVYFNTRVSSGTYIRSLVEDMGKELGTGAYMSDLRRTKVGNFTLDQAYEIENLTVSVREYFV